MRALEQNRRLQRGAALITSLILLLVMTMLAVTTMRSATLEERMARNSAMRHQALQAAESALVEAIESANYGTALNSGDPEVVALSARDGFPLSATVQALGSSESRQCRAAWGSSIGTDHECQPGATLYLFEFEIEAALEADGETLTTQNITAGVAYQ